ncbi:MAG: GNAT family N-acetyltransferase [Deltaproteobacteria bacterium]|nr:GNAT family N-acetyltransferase [Deltaproteobacteria bacterium]
MVKNYTPPQARDYAVRMLGTEYLDAVLDLEYLIFSTSWSKEQYAALIRGGRCVIFGVLGGEVLLAYAAAIISRAAKELEVCNIAVSLPLRRQGLGRSLMRAMFAAAEKLGLERAVLEVRSGNRAARGLYKKFGFTPCGLRRRYYVCPVEDAVLYEFRFTEASTGETGYGAC